MGGITRSDAVVELWQLGSGHRYKVMAHIGTPADGGFAQAVR